MLAEAKVRGDRKAVKTLEEIGPPPYPLASVQHQRRYLMKYGGAFHQPQSRFELIVTALRAPEASWPDGVAFVRGTAMSAGALWPKMQSLDANKAYPRLGAPVFFLLGRHDRQVSAELAAEYFERLEAPYKELVWFEDSAHAPPFEEPKKFNAEIVRIAREIGLLQRD